MPHVHRQLCEDLVRWLRQSDLRTLVDHLSRQNRLRSKQTTDEDCRDETGGNYDVRDENTTAVSSTNDAESWKSIVESQSRWQSRRSLPSPRPDLFVSSTVTISNFSSSLTISPRKTTSRIRWVDCRKAWIASSCVAERRLIVFT